MHAPTKTYNLSIPVMVTIARVLNAEEQGLWVSINDIDFDGIFPPLSAEEDVIRLIAENGMEWGAFAPVEWFVDAGDEEDLDDDDDDDDDHHDDDDDLAALDDDDLDEDDFDLSPSDADDDHGYSDVRWDFDGDPLS